MSVLLISRAVLAVSLTLSLGVLIPTRSTAQGSKPSVQEEISKLQTENAALRQENQRLRQMLAEPVIEKLKSIGPASATIAVDPAIPIPEPGKAAGKVPAYWLSLSGKRHNPRCRY